MALPIEDLVNIVVTASDRGRLVLFIGSGFSSYYGYPGWKTFAVDMLKGGLEKKPLEIDGKKYTVDPDSLKKKDEINAKMLIDFAKVWIGNGRDYGKLFKGCMKTSKPELESEAQKLIRKFKCSVVTTNADTLLDDVFKESEKQRIVYKSDDIISGFEIRDFDRNLWHIHGSVKETESLVFTQKEYAKRYNNRKYCKALDRFFSDYRPVIVFVGYGLAEDQVLQHIIRDTNSGAKNRYAILPRNKDVSFEDTLTEQIYQSEYNIVPVSYAKGDGKDSDTYGGMLNFLKQIAEGIEKRGQKGDDISNLYLDIENNAKEGSIIESYENVKTSQQSSLTDIQITCLLKANHYLSQENPGVTKIYDDLLSGAEKDAKFDLMLSDALLSYCLRFKKRIKAGYFYSIFEHSSIRPVIRVILEHGTINENYSKWYERYAESLIQSYLCQVKEGNECFEITEWFSTRIPGAMESNRTLEAILKICDSSKNLEAIGMDFTSLISNPDLKTYLTRCLCHGYDKKVTDIALKLISRGEKKRVPLFFALCIVIWSERPSISVYQKLLMVVVKASELPDNFYRLIFDPLPKLKDHCKKEEMEEVKKLAHRVISKIKELPDIKAEHRCLKKYIDAVYKGKTNAPYSEYRFLFEANDKREDKNVYAIKPVGGTFNVPPHENEKGSTETSPTFYETSKSFKNRALKIHYSHEKGRFLADLGRYCITSPLGNNSASNPTTFRVSKGKEEEYEFYVPEPGEDFHLSAKNYQIVQSDAGVSSLQSRDKVNERPVFDEEFLAKTLKKINEVRLEFLNYALSGILERRMEDIGIYPLIDKHGPNVLFSLENDSISYICNHYFSGEVDIESRLIPFLMRLDPPSDRRISSSSYTALFTALFKSVSKAIDSRRSTDLLSKGFLSFLWKNERWRKCIEAAPDDLEGPYGSKFSFVKLIGQGLEFDHKVSRKTKKVLSKLFKKGSGFSEAVQRVVFSDADYYFQKYKKLLCMELEKKVLEDCPLVANNPEIEFIFFLKTNKHLDKFMNNEISSGDKWPWICLMLEHYAQHKAKWLTITDFRGLKELPHAACEYCRKNSGFFVKDKTLTSDGERVLKFVKQKTVASQKEYAASLSDLVAEEIKGKTSSDT